MSDQDFFFDEDESARASKPAKGKAPEKAPAKAPAAKAATAPAPAAGLFFDQNVTMAVASLLMVIALLVGVILGFFLSQSMVPPPGVTSTPATSTGTGTDTGGGTQPGPLSPEQLNQGLPAGHVPVNTGAATGTTTP